MRTDTLRRKTNLPVLAGRVRWPAAGPRPFVCRCPDCACPAATVEAPDDADDSEPLEVLEFEEGEWEGEVDRSSRDYLRWVQDALNRFDGARLDVDGISGPLTRAAVRNFQARKGLGIDGIVGPITEAALVAAGARQPPGAAGSAPPPPPPPSGGAAGSPRVSVGSNAKVSAAAIAGLKEILRSAGLASALISSGQRSSADQARVMYENLAFYSTVAEQRALYGSYGNQVIDVFEAERAKGRSADAIKTAMQAKIVALGCYNVSHHCSDSHDVIDVAPSSIADDNAFIRALAAAKARGQISLYLTPDDHDPAFHIEFPPR